MNTQSQTVILKHEIKLNIKKHPCQKKRIVYYFSKTGNNKYLAEKLGENLNCETEQVKPQTNIFLLLLLATFLKINIPLKKLKHPITNYDQVIICSPIWIGSLISPLRSFLKKYKDTYKEVVFITCCGGTKETADGKFGYKQVFNKAKDIAGDKLVLCQAISILLAVPKDKREDDEEIMKTKLNDNNFKGEFEAEFDQIIAKVKNN